MHANTAQSCVPIDTLILDDSEFDLARLKRTLSKIRLPMTYREARNLHEFKEVAQATKFDLAFLDYDLPDGTGHEALKFLKEQCPTPSIMITGNNSSIVSLFAKRFGCYHCLPKANLSASSLKTAIESVLAAD